MSMNHMLRAIKTSQQLDMSTSTLLRMSLQCIKRNYSSSSDVPDSHLSQGQDILLHNMRSATDVADILAAVKLHYRIMNNKHLMEAFRSIFMLQKADKSEMSNVAVISNSGFRFLCETLKNNVRSLQTGELLDALKTLSYLGVSPTSKLVQILLHMLTQDVNSLTLQQMIFLDFLLKEFRPCPVVEGLKMSLPAVIDMNVKLKIDRENMPQMTDLLHYATKKNLSSHTIIFLMDLIMQQKKYIDLKSSKSIIRSLCDTNYCHESHKPLLHYAIDVLISNSHYCKYNDFHSLLSKIHARYTAKNNYFYHEHLLDTISTCIITESHKFEGAVWHLKQLLKFGHISYELLDYISQKIIDDPTILKTSNTLTLFTLVGGFAQADYVPHWWAAAEPIILDNAITQLDHVDLPWIKFTTDLCTLNCWPMAIFCRIFDKTFLQKYLASENNILDHLQVLALCSSIKSLCGWYSGPLLPQKTLNKALGYRAKISSECPLQKYLAILFGGSKFIRTGAITKNGHFIDYLVVLKKDGSPIPISNHKDHSSRLYVENFPWYNNSQKLGIIYMSRNSYTSNTNQLKGQIRMTIDALKSSNIFVIPVNAVIWEQLLEHERVAYLKQQITQSLPNLTNKPAFMNI